MTEPLRERGASSGEGRLPKESQRPDEARTPGAGRLPPGDPLPSRPPYELGPMPGGRLLETVDERIVRASVETMFELARDVERWPVHLRHYRYVRFRERTPDGGGLVEMSANRPFGPLDWPTWWLSEMQVAADVPSVRFRHVGGVTTRMDVEWTFAPVARGTLVRIVHVWDGPRWPLIGSVAATMVIGPVFVHGIASRTLAGLGAAAERRSRRLEKPS